LDFSQLVSAPCRAHKEKEKREAKTKPPSDSTPKIAKRAYELYEQQGHKSDSAVENWNQAEREIREGQTKTDPKPEAKAKPQAEAKVEPKPEAPKPEEKPTPKPEVKAESKPEPAAETA
jgi:hypothetical protein